MARVVVIDDDYLWLDSHRRQLESASHEVVVCRSLDEAVEVIDDTVDVVIADILLQYNTVFPLLHELQSDGDVADIPVILCSNIADSMRGVNLRPYGVRSVIDKLTMHPHDISATVKRVLL